MIYYEVGDILKLKRKFSSFHEKFIIKEIEHNIIKVSRVDGVVKMEYKLDELHKYFDKTILGKLNTLLLK